MITNKPRQRIRVTIEVFEDSESEAADISRSSIEVENDDCPAAIGMAVANALKGIVAQYSAGSDFAEFCKYLFGYMEQGEFTRRLNDLANAWWKLDTEDDRGFDKWMCDHIENAAKVESRA